MVESRQYLLEDIQQIWLHISQVGFIALKYIEDKSNNSLSTDIFHYNDMC